MGEGDIVLRDPSPQPSPAGLVPGTATAEPGLGEGENAPTALRAGDIPPTALRAASGGASGAVMQRRLLPAKGLDFFPTPPWATRAFLHEVLDLPGFQHIAPLAGQSVREPACGEGHMARVLGEVFRTVSASDVHDYGWGHDVASYVGQGPDVLPADAPDWIITNPPFNLALEFAERALGEARHGVALLLRTSWMEGGERYNRLFRDRPPSLICPYCERVPMVAGRYNPDAGTTTAYAWFVWFLPLYPELKIVTGLRWIPPGAKGRWFRREDVDGDGLAKPVRVDADREPGLLMGVTR